MRKFLKLYSYQSFGNKSRLLFLANKNMDINTQFQLSTNCEFFDLITKKIYTKFGFCLVDFAQIPLAHRGFENPLGHGAGPSGIFKFPLGSGDLGKNPIEKIRILYIN